MIGGLGLMAFLVVGSALVRRLSRARGARASARPRSSSTGPSRPRRSKRARSPSDEEPTDEEPVQGGDLALTSPDAGDLIFDPEALEAEAGEVVLTYTNPSEVPHNVAIEGDGEDLAQSETVTGGESADATAELEPGEYVFYCSDPRPPRGRDGRRPHRQVAA